LCYIGKTTLLIVLHR